MLYAQQYKYDTLYASDSETFSETVDNLLCVFGKLKESGKSLEVNSIGECAWYKSGGSSSDSIPVSSVWPLIGGGGGSGTGMWSSGDITYSVLPEKDSGGATIFSSPLNIILSSETYELSDPSTGEAFSIYIPFLFDFGVISSSPHGLTTGSGMSNPMTDTSGISVSGPSAESYTHTRSTHCYNVLSLVTFTATGLAHVTNKF